MQEAHNDLEIVYMYMNRLDDNRGGFFENSFVVLSHLAKRLFEVFLVP